jgi:chromosomal replication initiator protein
MRIADIQRATAEAFSLPLRELLSKRQDRRCARPRQVAMYLARELTVHSLPEIGREFDRDHTTIMHGIAQVEALMAQKPEFAARVEAIRTRLETGGNRTPAEAGAC